MKFSQPMCRFTVCGLVQIGGQLVLGGLFIDPLRLLPASLLLQGYNTTYPITYGAALLKPNGMFLLEPSFFSQMIAFGLLSEFVYFRRKWLIILLVVGLASSFSGTGLTMLLPALLFTGSPRVIFSFALLAALMIGALTVFGYGDIFLSRATETSQTGSSGNQRFVAPYQLAAGVWEEKTSDCLLGRGAGTADTISEMGDANYPAIPKVAIEYGAVGLVAFILLWITLFSGLALPLPLVVALLVFYFAASGAFLQPFSAFMTWALTAGFMRKQRKEGLRLNDFSPLVVPS
jgi:hypothetical protein